MTIDDHIMIRDGDWGLYVGVAGSTCIRHYGCKPSHENRGNCACGGSCHNCGVKTLAAMKGFRSMVQWDR